MQRPERRFWIELSYRYGTPVKLLQRIIDSRHFAELMAEERLCPRGPWREDYRAGVIASTMANAWRGKGQAAMKPTDFIPEFGERPRQSVEAAKLAAMRWCVQLGGTIEQART